MISSFAFHVSFVYAFYTIVSRRPLWNNIKEFGSNCSLLWMIHGDFNNVLNNDERRAIKVEVTPYEVKDFENCCLNVGLTDMWSIGFFYTWINTSIWSKIDRVMVNNVRVQVRVHSLVDFLPLGCLSDHFLCIVSLFEQNGSRSKPFRFFNM